MELKEIKFRAWQKDKKMMCEVKNIHFERCRFPSLRTNLSPLT